MFAVFLADGRGDDGGRERVREGGREEKNRNITDSVLRRDDPQRPGTRHQAPDMVLGGNEAGWTLSDTLELPNLFSLTRPFDPDNGFI